MSDFFEDRVEVRVGTQVIDVAPSGEVTVILGGPQGPKGSDGTGGGGGTFDHGELDGLEDDDHPQYLNEERGDDRYSLLGHNHPEYAALTYSMGFNGDLMPVGATYNLDGTITHPLLAFIPEEQVPAGTVLTFFILNSPNPAYDKAYTYTMADLREDNNWILHPFDNPFVLSNVGRVVSINFDFTENGPILGILGFLEGGWQIVRAYIEGTTIPLPAHNHDLLYAPVIHQHPVSAIIDAQKDFRLHAQEYLREEWDNWQSPIMLTNPTAASDNGAYSGSWMVLLPDARGTIRHTPAGLDIQWFGKVKKPFTQAEYDDAGFNLNNDPPGSPYQSFYEILTLIRPSIQNDWFEFARNMSTYLSPGRGRASYFYENTIIGGPHEEDNNAYFDNGAEVGQPERFRMTLDTDNSTLTFWDWMPFHTGDPTLEKCARGYWWKPVFSDLDDAWASMADPETETVPAVHHPDFNEGDPEIIQPWIIGIQGSLEIAELFMYEFGDPTPILQIDGGVLEAAGPDQTSFVDGAGNLIQTTTAKTDIAPGKKYVKFDSPYLLPPLDGVPDGKVLSTLGESWVIDDAPAGYTDENARDAIATALVAGDGIGITVDDAGDHITIASSITQYTDENARDTIGTALVAGTGVTKVVDDTNDTISLSVAVPQRLHVVGQYNTTGLASPVNTTVSSNRLYYIPFFVPRTASYDRIAVWHNAVTASIFGRLGIYSNLNDLPSSLITEYGTVDLSTTAAQFKSVTISVTLAPGIYWLAFVQQGTGSCTFTCGPPSIAVPSADNTVNGSKFENSVSGALPATATPLTGNASSPPTIFMRGA